MAYNPLEKLTTNIKAIRTALHFKSGTSLKEEELKSLCDYAGFGGIKAILYPKSSITEWEKLGASESDLRLYHPIMGLHELLENELAPHEYKQTIDSIRNSVLSAFYTPSIIPEVLYQVLLDSNIAPKKIYEPSAGAGIFITEAIKAFPNVSAITAVEKDLLTAKILTALSSSFSRPIKIHACGFEESPKSDNGDYDLVVSNIPFGNFAVSDPDFSDKAITGKIHNYFFAKGLDKCTEGGLLAYLTTSAFLNSPSNQHVREYLFKSADLISVLAMPDNLYKETGNTEASSHLLIVQKNSEKLFLSTDELLLLETREKTNEFGAYHINAYLLKYEEQVTTGNVVRPGKNQYGKASQSYRQDGPIELIKDRLQVQLSIDIKKNFNKAQFERQRSNIPQLKPDGKKFTYLKVPEEKSQAGEMQLGLFDVAPTTTANRALDYLTELDEVLISKASTRIISTIRTTDKPTHESIILIAGKPKNTEYYHYRLFSNLDEIKTTSKWMRSSALSKELQVLSVNLSKYGHDYVYEGDKSLEEAFKLTKANAPPLPFQSLKSFYVSGALVIHQEQVGTIDTPDFLNNVAVFNKMDRQDDKAYYKQYIQIRDQYLELFDLESNNNVDTAALREALNQDYDNFVSTYGQLNTPVNRKRIAIDTGFGHLLLSSLERKEGELFKKSDFLVAPMQRIEDYVTDNPVEALARSLNEKGKPDLDFIALSTKLSRDKTIEALSGHIYFNPVDQEWETASKYLSGNVVLKLKQAKEKTSVIPVDSNLQNSLNAVKKVQPEKIPYELLDFNLGERWIPIEYYTRFATHFFELNTAIHYFPSIDTFKVSIPTYNTKITTEFAVTPKNGRTTYGNTLLEHALENTSPVFTYEVSRGTETIRLPDNEATQLAYQKIENIRTAFTNWLNEQSIEDKKNLETLYNETFNCYVLQEYDGSHLTFPGLKLQNLGISDLYSSQKNAIWRIMQNRGALIDHEVGLGKTLTMIIAAMEMKRVGIANKPMILALKANVGEIADTFRLAYPLARILAPGKEDFTPKQRVRILHEIKNNNWDCVILTHDQFGRIPQSNEIMQEIFEIELNNTENDLKTVEDIGGDISRSMLKGLQIRKNNLDVKLKSVRNAIEEKRDQGINFNEMNVDHLFIDESHKFKNLTFTTRHNRVAGLGNQEGSQKALNMLFAIRTLQQRFDSDLCTTFLSGTPISNSLTELYLIFKYLRPKEMARQGIENFDGWAAVFARKTTDFEFSVTNQIIAKERFRHFIKVPELALFYNEITDYKTAKDIDLDKPKLDEKMINIPPTPDQTEFIKKLIEFAQTGDGTLIGRGRLTAKEDKGRMLIATNYAKKMAVDMRLIRSHYEDHPGSKVNMMIRDLVETYHESTPYKGVQLIFCDIGTPNTDGFNLYQDIKDKLAEKFGIPIHEIAFIHDWQGKKKSELFRKVNAGIIRIVIGSTEMLGTGTNIQSRIVRQHDLDIPWRPSDLEQRDGRSARKGNWVAKKYYENIVRKNIYATEQSLDTYKFNLLKNKQTFISQMKNSELSIRSIDEGSLDEKSGMNFSEYVAILSGDTSLLEKSKLDKKIAVLEMLRSGHFRECSNCRYQIERIQESITKTQNMLKRLEFDQIKYKMRLQFQKDGTKLNPINIDHFNDADQQKIGEYLIRLSENWKPGTNEYNAQKIGDLYGFHLYIEQQRRYIDDPIHGQVIKICNTFYAKNWENPEEIKYNYNEGFVNTEHPKLAARYFLNAINRIDSLVEKYKEDITKDEKEIPKLNVLLKKPFERETELNQLKAQVAELEKEINEKICVKQTEVPDTTNIEAVEELGSEKTASISSAAHSIPSQGITQLSKNQTKRPNKINL